MSAAVPLELSTGKQGQGSASFGPAGHTVVAPAFPVTVCHHAFSVGMGYHHGRASQEICAPAIPSLESGCVEALGRSQSCLLWVREAEALPAEVWLVLPKLPLLLT